MILLLLLPIYVCSAVASELRVVPSSFAAQPGASTAVLAYTDGVNDNANIEWRRVDGKDFHRDVRVEKDGLVLRFTNYHPDQEGEYRATAVWNGRTAEAFFYIGPLFTVHIDGGLNQKVAYGERLEVECKLMSRFNRSGFCDPQIKWIPEEEPTRGDVPADYQAPYAQGTKLVINKVYPQHHETEHKCEISYGGITKSAMVEVEVNVTGIHRRRRSVDATRNGEVTEYTEGSPFAVEIVGGNEQTVKYGHRMEVECKAIGITSNGSVPKIEWVIDMIPLRGDPPSDFKEAYSQGAKLIIEKASFRNSEPVYTCKATLDGITKSANLLDIIVMRDRRRRNSRNSHKRHHRAM